MPGAINHVITRGLNRQDIFLDDCDRNDFLGRLEKNLSLTGLQREYRKALSQLKKQIRYLKGVLRGKEEI